MRPLVPLALLALTFPGLAQDIELRSHPSRWRFTYESFADGGVDFGLMGVHLDRLDLAPEYPGLYGGVGGYAAVQGDVGGLFVGGVSVGFLRELYPGWSVDVGLFAGGGGGGDADVGSGFVLRPHVALELALGLVALRVEAASFDLGDIDADQHLAFGFTLPTEVLSAREGRRKGNIPASSAVWRRLRVTPTVMQLDPDSSSKKRDGTRLRDEIQLAGVEVDYFLSKSFYLPFEAFGAGGGSVAGFALGLVGLGMTWELHSDWLRLETKASVGGGGGGNVDTGGGLLWQATGGLSAELTDRLGIQVQAGRMQALDGELDATTVTAGVSWSARGAELTLDYPRSRLTREGIPGHLAELDSIGLSLLHKSYFPSSSATTTGGGRLENDLHLVGVGARKPLTRTISVTGRAFSAYSGGIGGYAEGLGGVRYEVTPFSLHPDHSFAATAEMGVAGGGGIDIGSGLIYELTAGYRYRFRPDLDFTLEGGTVEADRGTFQAEVLLVGLEWNLTRAILR